MRILGVDIPDNKIGEVSLSYIYGIGRPLAIKILQETGVGNKKVSEWSDDDQNKIRSYITLHNIKYEGELRAEVKMNIKRLEDINCYRGIRHKKNLPVRGQQTRTNCRTRKGKKKTVANKKKAEK
jgi:small subunit ribosomal protein S13